MSLVLDQVWRWLVLAATVGDFSSGANLEPYRYVPICGVDLSSTRTRHRLFPWMSYSSM